jgi:phytanoyl-CoA hydroxylase
MALKIYNEQIEFFQQHGYLLVKDFIDQEFARTVAERFHRIFRGEFETTIPPDEWRWAEGRDPEYVTRMIWNGWKSDRTIAQLSLSQAELIGFPFISAGTKFSRQIC